MKKMKSGFTLAEVLITLAIIGVVASLTLPSLMVNTGEQQSITAYKKILNSLTEAGQLNAAVNGFDYSTMTKPGSIDDDVNAGDFTLGAIIKSQLTINPNAKSVTLGTKGKNCAVLRDSTAICLGEESFNKVTGTDAKIIVVDTNGTKGPNVLSSCKEEACSTKKERKIYDQFHVTLYGGQAYPGQWKGTDAYNTSKATYAALYASGMGNVISSDSSSSGS